MKLVTFQPFTALPLPGLRAGATLTINIGDGPFKDWRVHVRGPAVFLVSPPGFKIGTPPNEWAGSDRRVYEIPRAHCYLGWQLGPTEKLDDVVKYSPACDDCDKPITLEDHITCAVCTKKRVDNYEEPAPPGAIPDPTSVDPGGDERVEIDAGPAVNVLAQGEALEVDELPLPTRTRKHR